MTNNDPLNKISYLYSTDIEDPWYTGNFEKVYTQIYNGCKTILNEIKGKI